MLDPWNVFTANFGTVGKPSTALVTLLDLFFYFLITWNVARARIQHKVPAPAMDGPDAFLRIFRVQMNTLEQLMLHLPILWIAAFAMDDVFAASFGSVWLMGRILYARGYYRKAKSRMKGFIVSMAMNVILALGALAGTLASF
ncbi:MAG: MAPEG family protein [Alphaproteobacteria bacterium]